LGFEGGFAAAFALEEGGGPPGILIRFRQPAMLFSSSVIAA